MNTRRTMARLLAASRSRIDLKSLAIPALARIAAVAFLSSFLPASAQSPASFPDFGQVDYFWAQNPQRFQSLWQAARTQTVRVVVLGDSQETNPGGAGLDYIPHLNHEMWKRFGNVPETPIQGCSSYGGGAPWADWLLRGACVAPGPSATRLAANQILPNLQPQAYSTLNGASNVNGEYLGQLTMLQQDAVGIDPAAAIPSNVDYFNTTGVVKARIFATTNPSSGEIAYWAQPTGANTPSYYAPTTTTGTLTLGLESATFAVKSGDTAALDFGGNRYMALQVAGTDDHKLTDIIGLRFFNETHPDGVIINTFSQGGYQASSFLANHVNAGDIFRALDFQAVILHYGANDSANNVSAQDFQTQINAVIALVRSWAGDPNLPVILIADVYRDNATAAQLSELDMYAGAQLAIAQADANVMMINARRLMDNIGWNAGSGQSSTFLIDRVHYTSYGAQVLAAAEVAAMMGEIVLTGCVTDRNSVVLQSTATLTLDIGGTTPCTDYPQYTVAQSLTLNRSTLNVVLTNGFTPTLGQTFKLLSWGTLIGTFGTITLPALSTGLGWDTTQLYTTGTIAVRPSAAPTLSITSGGNQSFPAGSSGAPVAFTVAGFGPLTVSAVSSNTTLLPNSGVSVSSSCGSPVLSCTADLAVAAGQTGTAVVTLTVRDSYGQSGSAAVTIAVTKPAAPTISVTSGGNQSITLGNSGAPIAFTLAGTGALNVDAVSSNATVLPSSGVSVNSSCGSSVLTCTADLAVAAGQTGTSVVTLTVRDSYGQSGSAAVTIAVTKPVAPTISITSGGNQSLTLGIPAAPIVFTLAGTGALNVVAVSSNTTLLPSSGVSVNSSCGSTVLSCTANLTVAVGQTGSSTVSLSVEDAYGQSATGNATIQVNPDSNKAGAGGGGAVDVLSLLWLAVLGIMRRRSLSYAALAK